MSGSRSSIRAVGARRAAAAGAPSDLLPRGDHRRGACRAGGWLGLRSSKTRSRQAMAAARRGDSFRHWRAVCWRDDAEDADALARSGRSWMAPALQRRAFADDLLGEARNRSPSCRARLAQIAAAAHRLGAIAARDLSRGKPFEPRGDARPRHGRVAPHRWTGRASRAVDTIRSGAQVSPCRISLC